MIRLLPTAVLCGVLVTSCGGKGGRDAGPREAPRVPVEIVTAAAAPFTETYRVTAVALPIRVHYLSAEVGGTLVELDADVGSRVKEGDVLARLDPVPLTLARDTARAERERAQVRLDLARKAYARQEALHRQGSVADPVLEEAELTVKLAEAELKLAGLRLEETERDLSHTVIRAPADGEITQRLPEVNQVLAPGAPLFHLARTDRIRFNAGLSEQQVVHVREGAKAALSLDALPERAFTGRVTRVGSVDKPGEAAFPVEVRVDNPDGAIRPGMVARITLTGRKMPEALQVPSVALRRGADGLGLFVVDKGTARRRPVTLEALVDERAVIGEGLTAGEQVVVVGQTALKDGEPVQITVKDGRQTSVAGDAPVYGLP